MLAFSACPVNLGLSLDRQYRKILEDQVITIRTLSVIIRSVCVFGNGHSTRKVSFASWLHMDSDVGLFCFRLWEMKFLLHQHLGSL